MIYLHHRRGRDGSSTAVPACPQSHRSIERWVLGRPLATRLTAECGPRMRMPRPGVACCMPLAGWPAAIVCRATRHRSVRTSTPALVCRCRTCFQAMEYVRAVAWAPDHACGNLRVCSANVNCLVGLEIVSMHDLKFAGGRRFTLCGRLSVKHYLPLQSSNPHPSVLIHSF